MTALKVKLQEAGLDAATRLVALEDEIVATGASFDVALAQWRARVSGDAALLWEAFAQQRDRVGAERLRAAFARKHPSRPRDVSGRASAARGTHSIAAAGAAIRSILDTLETPLGRALGDITGAEAQALHGRARRDVRLYAHCASRTPAGEKVRDHVSPEEIEALLRAAALENDHAQ